MTVRARLVVTVVDVELEAVQLHDGKHGVVQRAAGGVTGAVVWRMRYSLYVVVWYSVVWCGVVWYGMVWYGMVWYGL